MGASKKKNVSKGGHTPGVDALPSGVWRVRVMVRGRRITELCASREEAVTLRRALLQEAVAEDRAAREASRASPAVETLTTWGAAWMKRRSVRWPEDDKARWRKHVEGTPLAALPLGSIRPRDVRAWVEGMMVKRKDGGALLSRQTITHAFNLVRKALADATADERITANPAEGVRLPKRAERRDADPWTYLTADEVRAVESCAAMPEGARLTFVVAIYTGMRAGELWALRWRDVETGGTPPRVTVRASHKNAPKNGKVQRLPLLPAARAAFERLRELAGVEGIGAEGDALVFPAPRGGQRHRDDDAGWSSRKRRAKFVVGLRELAGITRRVRFHDLRHTFASHLVMGTWTTTPLPLAEVCALMRHGSVSMTERYAHLAPEHLHARVAGTPPPRPAVASPMPAGASDVATVVDAPVAPQNAPQGGAEGELHDAAEDVTNLPPQDLVTPSPRFARNTLFLGACPGRFERPTGGLEGRAATAGIPGENAVRDQPVTNEGDAAGELRGVALAFLRAVDEGRPAGALARELAVEMLRQSAPDSPAWWGAVATLEGGHLRIRHAVELAGRALDADVQQQQQRTAG